MKREEERLDLAPRRNESMSRDSEKRKARDAILQSGRFDFNFNFDFDFGREDQRDEDEILLYVLLLFILLLMT